MKLSRSDRLYYTIVNLIMFILLLVVMYPLVYILSASFSSPLAVSTGRVVLWPVDFSIKGYQKVFEYESVWIGYRNTLLYTISGTALNVAMTLSCAYALARKTLPGLRGFTLLFAFTMIFSGGLIPTYLLVNDLGLMNTPWAMIIPGALSVYNMVITRTFIQNSIPQDIYESAQLDGCSDIRYFFTMVLPLSKAIIAVISLYYAVAHWNSYFNALIYLSSKKLFPLQLFLREILVMNQINISDLLDEEQKIAQQGMADLLKYSLIVVATVPILCIYPFAQRYFVKGVMIGSLKG